MRLDSRLSELEKRMRPADDDELLIIRLTWGDERRALITDKLIGEEKAEGIRYIVEQRPHEHKRTITDT